MKHKQYGFGVVGIIAIILVVAFIGFALTRVTKKDVRPNNESQSSSQESTNSSNNGSQKVTKDSIELQNIGLVNYDAVNYSTYAIRDYKQNQQKGFYFFGDDLPGGGRKNPNYEFSSIKDETQIVAAIDGTITFIKDQPESSDYEVFLQTSENSQWIIGYDHLTNLKVKKGDKVKAGEVLGEAAKQNNGLNRFEFQVNKKTSGAEDTHICPNTLLSASAKPIVEAGIKQIMEKWNALAGYKIYDDAAIATSGCLVNELTVQQAQGI